MHRTPAPTRPASLTVFFSLGDGSGGSNDPAGDVLVSASPRPLARDILFFSVQSLLITPWSVAGRQSISRGRCGPGSRPARGTPRSSFRASVPLLGRHPWTSARRIMDIRETFHSVTCGPGPGSVGASETGGGSGVRVERRTAR